LGSLGSWLGVVEGVRAAFRVVSWPGRSEHSRAAVAGVVAGAIRGALCSSLPEVRLRAGMGGAPQAPSRRGEAPLWPVGVGRAGTWAVPCRAGPARLSRALCRVGFEFLDMIGTLCRAVLAR